MHTIFNVKLQNTTMDSKKTSTIHDTTDSKRSHFFPNCRLSVLILNNLLVSKLLVKVTHNKLKPGQQILVLHLMIQMAMNSNDFTHPELAGRLSSTSIV